MATREAQLTSRDLNGFDSFARLIANRICEEVHRRATGLILVAVSQNTDIPSVLPEVIETVSKQSRAVVLNQLVNNQAKFLDEMFVDQELDPELERILVGIKRSGANIFLFVEDVVEFAPAVWKQLVQVSLRRESGGPLIQLVVAGLPELEHELIADCGITPEELSIIRTAHLLEKEDQRDSAFVGAEGPVDRDSGVESDPRIHNLVDDDFDLLGDSAPDHTSNAINDDIRGMLEKRQRTSLHAVSAARPHEHDSDSPPELSHEDDSASPPALSHENEKRDVTALRSALYRHATSPVDGTYGSSTELMVPALSLEAHATSEPGKGKRAFSIPLYFIPIAVVLAAAVGAYVLTDATKPGVGNGESSDSAPVQERTLADTREVSEANVDDLKEQGTDTEENKVADDGQQKAINGGVESSGKEVGKLTWSVQFGKDASTAQNESIREPSEGGEPTMRTNIWPDPSTRPRFTKQDPVASPQIEELLRQAAGQMANQQLTLPVDDSALDTYREILRLDADNEQARSGIDQIKDTYVQWAGFARDRGDLEKIAEYYERAQRIDPGDDDFLTRLKLPANATKQSADDKPIDSNELNTSGRVEKLTLLSSPTALADHAFVGDIEGVRRLLGAGLSSDYNVDVDGFTPLMYAAMNGHLEVAKALLEGGANVDARTHDSRTALMLAAKNGRLRIVQLLLRYNADVNLETDAGWTALAFSEDHEVIHSMLLAEMALIQNRRSQQQQ